ncbi:dipeptide transport system permease DppB [Klebsiella pneumoniae]|nr:dipeptide transport system permease DppB [Klebsiella pneumoniae]
MLNYVIKRLLGLIPTLLIVAVLVFLFVHMLPGDPARLIAGPEADAQVVAMVRQQLGLDQPLHVQFLALYHQRAARRFWHFHGLAASRCQ